MDASNEKRYTNGREVARLRIKMGMSQEQLSDKSNVSRSQIQRIEKDTQQDIKIGTIMKLAEALDVPWKQLIL